MLWSSWAKPRRGHDLASPKRFTAYLSRRDAPARGVGGHERIVVALVLRPTWLPAASNEGAQVDIVPEFNVVAVGGDFRLQATWSEGAFLVRGEVPAALWYEEPNQ